MFETRPRFWSPRGRANRALYWQVAIATAGTGFFAELLVLQILAGVEPGARRQTVLAYWLLVAALEWLFIATVIRRLHDHDKSGWWAIPMMVVPNIIVLVLPKIPESAASEISAIAISLDLVKSILWIIATGLFVWTFISLGCTRGTVGDNRFGPDPLPAPKADETSGTG